MQGCVFFFGSVIVFSVRTKTRCYNFPRGKLTKGGRWGAIMQLSELSAVLIQRGRKEETDPGGADLCPLAHLEVLRWTCLKPLPKMLWVSVEIMCWFASLQSGLLAGTVEQMAHLFHFLVPSHTRLLFFFFFKYFKKRQKMWKNTSMFQKSIKSPMSSSQWSWV